MIYRMYFSFLIVFLGFISCAQDIDRNKTSEPSQNKQESEKVPINIDSLWQNLIFEKGGCLTGGHRVIKGRFGGEGCVLTEASDNKYWHNFFELPKNEIAEFLITQISDTTTTKIHTCPCMSSKAGEVAVYCLHKIYLTNWWELEGFEDYATKESMGCFDGDQSWLWDIMLDEKQRMIMENAWRSMLNSK